MRSIPHKGIITQNNGNADAGYTTTTARTSSIINWSMLNSIAHLEQK